MHGLIIIKMTDGASKLRFHPGALTSIFHGATFGTSLKPTRRSDFSKSHQRGYGHANVLSRLNLTVIYPAPELAAVFGAFVLCLCGCRAAALSMPGSVFSWGPGGCVFHPYKPNIT